MRNQELGSSVAIETGIPIPSGWGKYGQQTHGIRHTARLLAASPVGSSVFYAIPDGVNKGGRANSICATFYHEFGAGWVTKRQVEGGVRIWKIAEPTRRAKATTQSEEG